MATARRKATKAGSAGATAAALDRAFLDEVRTVGRLVRQIDLAGATLEGRYDVPESTKQDLRDAAGELAGVVVQMVYRYVDAAFPTDAGG